MSDSTTPQDDKAMSPASAGSYGEHGQAMFPERSSMANAAERWCDQIGVSPVAFNVVTALFRLGLVQKPDPQPTLTNEEREAVHRLCRAVTHYSAGGVAVDGGSFARDDERAVAVVRGWLARLT